MFYMHEDMSGPKEAVLKMRLHLSVQTISNGLGKCYCSELNIYDCFFFV